MVNRDLEESKHPLVISGYASIDHLIRWLSQCQERIVESRDAHQSIRLLLGNEPPAGENRTFGIRQPTFRQEVIDYWSRRGVSLRLSARVIMALELLKARRVQVRVSGVTPVHAKVYVGDDAVTLGSSNYTTSGLYRNVEANVRFDITDGVRLREARSVAEAIWSDGAEFTEEFIGILNRLLQCVTWQEALARACAELLEGHWARQSSSDLAVEGFRLWPAQEQGIAHALWILENQGSVLVADATGSGKTLMGAHLLKRIMAQLARTGRGRNEVAALMAPPAVLEDWDRFAAECGAPVRGFSQGHLSNSAGKVGELLRKVIRRAQVLAIDEAHNFLRTSKRRAALFGNIADHVVLLTATPISKGARDMLAIVDLLGADNLDDKTNEVLASLWKRRGDLTSNMSEDDEQELRDAIRRFTVRRTKEDLNRLVDLQPEAYRAQSGRVARYPKHVARVYQCNETEEDLEICRQIRAAAAKLRGLTRFKANLELPELMRRMGQTEKQYLDTRLRGAAALAAHAVAASLRSSRVKLQEHIRGSVAVFDQRPELRSARLSEKNGALRELQETAGNPPKSLLGIPLPKWLSDPEAHAEACYEEQAILKQIDSLADGLSESRENAKAHLIANLIKEHGLVLAFDSYLITLTDLERRLEPLIGDNIDIIVATGQAKTQRKQLYERFNPESKAKGVIALCSDAVAEGVNLQAASAVVMLDMPSVIRIAEQRIGRVDRMNSPHDSIEAYWPVDAPPFALRANERFIERHKFVKRHIGANLKVPEALGGDGDAVVDAMDYAAEVERALANRADAEGLQDAFASVRALVEGESSIVPQSVYAMYRASQATVLSSISVIKTDTSFAFLAIAGTEWGAPRWVYLKEGQGTPVVDLDEIATALRAHLAGAVEPRSLDAPAMSFIEHALQQLEAKEEALLPRGKQRALTEMRLVLRRYRKTAQEDPERTAVIDDLLRLAEGSDYEGTVDRGALANWWLRVIQPVKMAHLMERTRSRPVLLKNLRAELTSHPLPTSELKSAFNARLLTKPLAERVVAAIIGVRG